MQFPGPPLPIDPLLPELVALLARSGQAVFQAPPGAGKTTRVPLALLAHVTGRIVLLEPRRLAARASAERMAETLGEAVGGRVGYRIRGEARISRATRIEVVTEGILTRMLQSDPALEGVGAVIFDEFHERSLNADLGLALVLEARAALRPDLKLVVMSATLDAAPVAALLGAETLTAEGRAYPVETRWLDRAPAREARLEQTAGALVLQALAETEGGVLVFLPGEGEIRRLTAWLDGRLPPGVALQPLFGAMDFAAQRAALAPMPGKRKLVLATSIAETSLTIPDIRVVMDAGLSRRARFDPGSGMARLVTEPVSRAEAEQRRGRAGRVAPGVCYRMWPRGQEGALPAYPPAEIEVADLAALALELALWGSDALPFLTAPPAPALSEARALLQGLDALDGALRITAHGKALAALPLHPRLGHMLLRAGKGAAPLAALMAERDPTPGAGVDLGQRLRALDGTGPPLNRDRAQRIRLEARRLAALAPADQGLSPAEMAALAYPDRIALRRAGDAPRYLLSGGKGAVMDSADPLAIQRILVVTDLDGDPREARIRLALPLSESALRGLFGDQIAWVERCEWSAREGRIVARREERFGALTLAQQPWEPPAEARARAALDGMRALGLAACLSAPARRLLARVARLRGAGAQMPDLSETALLGGEALLPALTRIRNSDDLRALDLTGTLQGLLTWDQAQMLDRLAPAQFTTPMGRHIPIDHDSDPPEISLKLQEMFGVTRHPMIGDTPLKITLLSPAGRPVQVTTDLPGFWANGYAEVRKDLRGRYPRHPWPEDPTVAEPTLRAKPRGT